MSFYGVWAMPSLERIRSIDGTSGDERPGADDPRAHPVAFPSRPPAEQLTAGFARASDASYAIGILQACGDGPVRATIEPVLDERGEIRLVVLHIELEGVSRDRALAAISGAHGVEMAAPARIPAAAPPFDEINARSA